MLFAIILHIYVAWGMQLGLVESKHDASGFYLFIQDLIRITFLMTPATYTLARHLVTFFL
jgi:hypothetical protein